MATIKISELDAVTSLDGTELIEVVQGGTNKKATVSQVLPYKVYTALLSQSGTDAPVATVLQNTLGGEVVWTRDDVGSYVGTLTAAFTTNKVQLFIASGGSVYNSFAFFTTSEDTVLVVTAQFDAGDFTQFDSLLSNCGIRIEVYP